MAGTPPEGRGALAPRGVRPPGSFKGPGGQSRGRTDVLSYESPFAFPSARALI